VTFDCVNLLILCFLFITVVFIHLVVLHLKYFLSLILSINHVKCLCTVLFNKEFTFTKLAAFTTIPTLTLTGRETLNIVINEEKSVLLQTFFAICERAELTKMHGFIRFERCATRSALL
jgi:hypothetical protein